MTKPDFTKGQMLFMNSPPEIQELLKTMAVISVSLSTMLETGLLKPDELGADGPWLKKAIRTIEEKFTYIGLSFPGENVEAARKAAGPLWEAIMTESVHSLPIKTSTGEYGLIAGEIDVVASVQGLMLASGAMDGDVAKNNKPTLNVDRAKKLARDWAEKNMDPEFLADAKKQAAMKMVKDLLETMAQSGVG
ncbi:hypothetical protein [Hyphomicrobium sp.]|uniref:hypothetical protein n=1 Tax=Hyphomicrobium sp. TaxID=82 RepID=UPI001D30846D|nr:hypothetical protein [Hyphomicrobium sp.]MBY0562467.1 hypothetical protein [Hyphomicrobium sp.]